jgi:hypothetical protein
MRSRFWAYDICSMIGYEVLITYMRVKKAVTYKTERKGEVRKDVEEVADKVKAGAKTVYNKLDNSYGELKVAYQKEKRKHR